MRQYFIIMWDAVKNWIRDFNNDFNRDFTN